MSNDKALIVVEAAQSPQVVAMSDVLTEEIEYQRAWKQAKADTERFHASAIAYLESYERLARAWLAEHYPEAQLCTYPYERIEGYLGVDIGMRIDITSSNESPAMILQELDAHLAQLQR